MPAPAHRSPTCAGDWLRWGAWLLCQECSSAVEWTPEMLTRLRAEGRLVEREENVAPSPRD